MAPMSEPAPYRQPPEVFSLIRDWQEKFAPSRLRLLLERAASATERVVTDAGGFTADLDDAGALGRQAVIDEALAALDEIDATVRPALVALRAVLDQVAELSAAEKARAAADLAAYEQALAVESAVARGVARSEAERLAAIEANVREELAAAGSAR